MTAGGYKESYCEGYVDQQSGNSSNISAGNNLQVTAGSLANIGSLITAGTSATINVAGPVVNEAQTLNAYWHSHWVQETGDFSSDIRHDVWACGSVAECTKLYGSAYTQVGGTIDPPQPTGNIAATIQAPNLSISADGVIQNVGNVIGTSVQLTGQKLINGITTANTYTPRVNGPSQIISLSGFNLPGLRLSSLAGGSGSSASSTPGQASYVQGVAGGTGIVLGPQQLLGQLPSNLQPSSTIFYYNPEAEDLMLQQAALQQTGEASFIGGLSYDRTTGLSVTDQEKAILYQNALDYAKQNNLQLGVGLSQTQVNALTQPMLWYVEQTVPDPSCLSTGVVGCPTVTALMPQVYLPENWSALSADGNIVGQNVTLNFNKDSSGSILNTGDIAASDTLTVNTNTLTNRANQVDVGQIWQYLQATGYEDTTGTTVQPGGFMSAANMNLNVQTLNQIGGALQSLSGDGTINQAGTQQLVAALQQQLGTNFAQTSLSDNLHTSFTAEGGFGAGDIAMIAFTIVVSIMTAGAASAAIGAVSGATAAASSAAAAVAADGTTAMATAAAEAGGTFMAATAGASAGLANIALSAGIAGMVSSAMSQLAATGSINIGSVFEAGAIAGLTAGVTNGITYNSSTGLGFTTGSVPIGEGTSTLSQLAGVSNIGNSIVPQAGKAAGSLSEALTAMGASSALDAGIQTAIGGGSFLNNLTHDAVGDLAAAGAYAIGDALPGLQKSLGDIGGEAAYIGLHGALGCAASAAEGTGCAGGAIGGAASAAFSPDLLKAIDPTGAALDPGQQAAMAGFATLLGGSLAGLAGANAQGGANTALNEVLNNTDDHPENAAKNGGLLSQLEDGASAVIDWFKTTYHDPLGDTERGINKFLSAGNRQGQNDPYDPTQQVDPTSGPKNHDPSAPAPVTPMGALACLVGGPEGCLVSELLGAAPVSPPPSNGLLSSGNGDGGSSNGSTGPVQSAEGTGGGTNATRSTSPKIGLYKGATQETIDKINQVIQVAEDTTTGSGTKNFTMPTQSSRQAAFDYLAEGAEQATMETPKGPIQSATLADGTKIVSRPFSSGMSGNTPTIQIMRPGGGTALEIRFPQ